LRKCDTFCVDGSDSGKSRDWRYFWFKRQVPCVLYLDVYIFFGGTFFIFQNKAMHTVGTNSGGCGGQTPATLSKPLWANFFENRDVFENKWTKYQYMVFV